MSNSNSVLWIILRKSEKPNGNTDFQQDGPYTTAEVQELLGRGLLRTSDFVWKKGAEAWIPVTDVDEFNLLNLKETQVPKRDFDKIVEFEVPGQKSATEDKRQSPKFSFHFLKGKPAYLAAPIIIFVMFGIYKLVPKKIQHEIPPVAEVAKTNMTVAQAVVAPPAPEVTPVEPVTQAQISNKFLIKTVARDFQVTGPFDRDQKINVILKAKTGEVLEVPALYLKFQIIAKKSGEVFVSHKNYQIPQGKFDVSVNSNSAKEAHFKITLAEPDTDLEKALKAQRKKIAFDQQSEKRNFIRFIEKLEKQSSAAKSTKLLPKELQWVQQDRNYLVFRTDWIKLQKLMESGGSRSPSSVKDRERALRKLRAEVQAKSSASNPN